MIYTAYFGPRSTPRENEIIGGFVCDLIWDGRHTVKDFCSMGVFDDDELIAGVLYHNWYPDNGVIELTSAATSKRWLTRRVIRAMFHLPFHLLGCQMCLLRVSERNETMVHIARSFGFDEIYVPRLFGRDEGAYLFTLTDEQWAQSPYNDTQKAKRSQ